MYKGEIATASHLGLLFFTTSLESSETDSAKKVQKGLNWSFNCDLIGSLSLSATYTTIGT